MPLHSTLAPSRPATSAIQGLSKLEHESQSTLSNDHLHSERDQVTKGLHNHHPLHLLPLLIALVDDSPVLSDVYLRIHMPRTRILASVLACPGLSFVHPLLPPIPCFIGLSLFSRRGSVAAYMIRDAPPSLHKEGISPPPPNTDDSEPLGTRCSALGVNLSNMNSNPLHIYLFLFTEYNMCVVA